jgi:Cu-Zn family superoxide dismutase
VGAPPAAHFELDFYKKAPGDAERHAGDLGNVTADAGGVVRASFSVAGLSLRSTDAGYIISRSVMLHADADDGGLLGFADSLTTGHAGARIA